jgi:hypothetical protein
MGGLNAVKLFLNKEELNRIKPLDLFFKSAFLLIFS